MAQRYHFGFYTIDLIISGLYLLNIIQCCLIILHLTEQKKSKSQQIRTDQNFSIQKAALCNNLILVILGTNIEKLACQIAHSLNSAYTCCVTRGPDRVFSTVCTVSAD